MHVVMNTRPSAAVEIVRLKHAIDTGTYASFGNGAFGGGNGLV
jgi:hypothetical protein